MRDVITYFKAVTAGTVLAVIVNLGLYRFISFSRTVFVIYWMILFVLVTASRFSYRLIEETTPKNSMKGGTRALIYGAGAGGQLVMQEIERNQHLGLALVGFIDDDIRKQNRKFAGYPIFGGKDCLSEIVHKNAISEVIVSFQNIDRGAKDALKRECSSLGVNLSRVRVSIDGFGIDI